MSASADTKELLDLNEEKMIGEPVHLLCCNSDFLALCNKRPKGPKLPQETPLSCAVCVEQSEERNKAQCWSDHTKCAVVRDDNKIQD